MPDTWKWHSEKVLGYVAPITKTNDVYVTANIVQDWLDEGKTLNKILLSWNAGEGAKKCGKGKNKFGIKYDSCSYISNGLIAYNIINKAEANEEK